MKAMLRFDPLKAGLELGHRGQAAHLHAVPSDPILVRRLEAELAAMPRRRARIWEMASHLHCSIIGTCLSTAELRQLLTKVSLVPPGASDHDLHAQGVMLASRRDGAAKLLNKALDQRHRLVIKQFDKASDAEEVRTLWRVAVQRGEIPGAYWAVLSHPATTQDLVREVFGEVHMLSHLVGAANRADIRRLSQLEAENAELRAKVQRQQDQLREAVTTRDATIRGLNALLAEKISDEHAPPNDNACGEAAWSSLVADLERRLQAETRRRAALEQKAARLRDDLARERELRLAAEQRETALREELEAVEASIAPAAEAGSEAAPARHDLSGRALLYVGGRPNQVSHIRALAESVGVDFLHHDGGIDDRSGLLAGLVGRADIVMFPVDCVSHDAAGMVKRLCRQTAKPYLPLRSAAASSFLAALSRVEIAFLRNPAEA